MKNEYICNKIGKRQCCKVCPHGIPHDLLIFQNELCNMKSTCSGYDSEGNYGEIDVKCKKVK